MVAAFGRQRQILPESLFTGLQSSSGAHLGARKVVRAEKDGGNDEVSAVGNVAHTGALTLALVHDSSNLMTSLRLLVALLGAWDARCDRPWQRMEDKDIQALQYTPRPSPSTTHCQSARPALSPLPSTPSLYPVARPLTIFRSRCLNLLKRRTSRGISTRICPPEQEMVETMVAQLAEAFPRPKRCKVTILHR